MKSILKFVEKVKTKCLYIKKDINKESEEIRPLFWLGAEKITFYPKHDGHTDIRTDISIYRVASLLKIIVKVGVRTWKL